MNQRTLFLVPKPGNSEQPIRNEKAASDLLLSIAKNALDRIAQNHKSHEFGHYSKLRKYVEDAFALESLSQS
jgi:hypothetical protein